MTKEILNMDCLDVLTKLDSNSVDLVVTDPPYGYSFMGKDWDKVVLMQTFLVSVYNSVP